jgi:type II secretory pathway component HofQ
MRSAASFSTITLFCLLLSSCQKNTERQLVQFKDIYGRIAFEVPSNFSQKENQAKFSFSAYQAPLNSLLRQIADQTSISVIAHNSLESAKVTFEVKDAPVSEVLASIARSLDKRLTRIGEIYFLGPVEPEDRGSLVRRVRRLNQEELNKITELFRSEYGRSHVSDDGLVVVADRVEVLERLSQTFDQVEKAPVSSWVIQLVVVALSDRMKNTLGIKTDMTAQFAANLATPSTSTHTASLAFTSLLQSVHDSTDSKIIAEPLLVVRDGATSTIRRGEDLRLPKKTTSPYGTVEVTGYEVIPTGLTITTTLRDDTVTHASVKLKVESSSISGESEGAPIVTTQSLESATSLATGGVYLLGAIESAQLSRSLSGSPVPLLFSRDRQNYTLQIWAKCYRIAGPLSQSQVERAQPSQAERATAEGEGPRPGAETPAAGERAAPSLFDR